MSALNPKIIIVYAQLDKSFEKTEEFMAFILKLPNI